MNESMLWFSFNKNNNNNNNTDIIINFLLKSHKNLIKTTHKTSVYYIHFEITGYPCNLIGSQRCDL